MDRNNTLLTVLRGRDGRERMRRHLLLRYPTIVQMAFNIPGYPKHLPEDLGVLQSTLAYWRRNTPDIGPHSVIFLDNPAGKTFFLGYRVGSAKMLKAIAWNLEEILPWGRMLDLDVVNTTGPLSRSIWGLAPRRCLLCHEEAKICARRGAHSLDALRLRAKEILLAALQPNPWSLPTSSPFCGIALLKFQRND